MANVAKVGLQFEQVLISGIMNHVLAMPNNTPEFRYSTHEATEECHHTQMFQEFVNRSGEDVPGGRLVPPGGAGAPAGCRTAPFVFFIGVLAGEEPIDHLQKSVLRAGDDFHPLMTRIMQIHVAEEARHIGFAPPVPQQRARARPAAAGAALGRDAGDHARACDVIMKPSKQVQRDLGIPQKVVDEVWWDSDEARSSCATCSATSAPSTEELGLMNKVSRRVWRALGIDGRPSRFRSEPASAGGLTHAPLRRHPVVLRRRLVRRRMPGQLHPPGAR